MSSLCVFNKKVSVQAPFRHRYRFKSTGLAPVSEKNQKIPIPSQISSTVCAALSYKHSGSENQSKCMRVLLGVTRPSFVL